MIQIGQAAAGSTANMPKKAYSRELVAVDCLPLKFADIVDTSIRRSVQVLQQK